MREIVETLHVEARRASAPYTPGSRDPQEHAEGMALAYEQALATILRIAADGGTIDDARGALECKPGYWRGRAQDCQAAGRDRGPA